MKHTISLFITLAAFWLLNSGHYSVLILSLGLASIALIIYIANKMDVVDQESQPLYLSRKIFGYYFWLIIEIIKANTTVVKHIWLGKKTISPTLKKIKVTQQTDMGKVIYANSITLTPGTVAIDINEDEILVHALIAEDLDSLEFGEMDRRVTSLEN
ncbi:Na+/H+ antiporter subunit E [Thalassomonas sp. M1454]|uniref:Na+/H+ antiporter subunit E n=1 Tax=Thalassomonas sp. M1454 TaxID=2594477 RepID=UPI00117C08E5|nr:Na+/H+ antiporter subunit E [Thalassomonas sp. M1454]TRX56447.1 cation transporter [Thalassomonas sp. M1454]